MIGRGPAEPNTQTAGPTLGKGLEAPPQLGRDPGNPLSVRMGLEHPRIAGLDDLLIESGWAPRLDRHRRLTA